MIQCSLCRGLMPADCPACDSALRACNDNEPFIPEQQIVAEMFRDVGEEIDESQYSDGFPHLDWDLR